MPNPKFAPREQLGVRVSPLALELLGRLQSLYAGRMGEGALCSQSQAVEIIIRDVAKREGIRPPKSGGGSK
jgi:hypothetical protein